MAVDVTVDRSTAGSPSPSRIDDSGLDALCSSTHHRSRASLRWPSLPTAGSLSPWQLELCAACTARGALELSPPAAASHSPSLSDARGTPVPRQRQIPGIHVRRTGSSPRASLSWRRIHLWIHAARARGGSSSLSAAMGIGPQGAPATGGINRAPARVGTRRLCRLTRPEAKRGAGRSPGAQHRVIRFPYALSLPLPLLLCFSAGASAEA